jgi:hypothetical protein
VAVAHGPVDRIQQVIRSFEPEGDRVPDVQVPDFSARRLNLLRFRDDMSDRVSEAVDSVRCGDCGRDFRGGHLGILLLLTTCNFYVRDLAQAAQDRVIITLISLGV